MTHFIEVCEFGAVHAQCRCPDPSKSIRPVTCTTPKEHGPGKTSETLGFDRPASVDNPTHYRVGDSGVECIEIVRHLSFNLGNAVKYLWRIGNKDEAAAELKKAIWYLTDEWERLIESPWRLPGDVPAWADLFWRHIITLPPSASQDALSDIRSSIMRRGSLRDLRRALTVLRKEAQMLGIEDQVRK